jgi:hypothetical protein
VGITVNSKYQPTQTKHNKIGGEEFPCADVSRYGKVEEKHCNIKPRSK